MLSKIVINTKHLQDNLNYIKKHCSGNICAMVKANAYGHGIETVVPLLSGQVSAFGVVNVEEAVAVRQLDEDTKVIIFGVCNDIETAIRYDVSLSITSVDELYKIVDVYKKCKQAPRLHLNINTGMNRFGIQDKKDLQRIIRILQKNKLNLEGIFTHFSSLTTDDDYTKHQKDMFDDFVHSLPKSICPIVHVGGGNSIYEFKEYDMYRVGMFLYSGVKQALSVQSQIVAIQNVKKGEHVGYMCAYTADKDMKVGVVPLGYNDGIKRGLSNNFTVKINGKECKNVGNVCMDCFMVEIDKKVKVGDEVVVMEDAKNWADKLGTTEYEILTNFNSFRGERI